MYTCSTTTRSLPVADGRKVIDLCRELYIKRREASAVVSKQSYVNSIIDIKPFWMMIQFFSCR